MSILSSTAVTAANVSSSSFQTISAQQPRLIGGFIPSSTYVLPAIARAQTYVSPFSLAAANPQCPARNFSMSYTTPPGTRLV